MDHPVLQILAEMGDVAVGKAHDYAADDNVFSNFINSAEAVGVTPEQAFHLHIATKFERLRQLVHKGEVVNEPIEDTLLDLANYAALWLAYRRCAYVTMTPDPLVPRYETPEHSDG